MSGIPVKYLFDRPRSSHPWENSFFSDRGKLEDWKLAVLNNYEMDSRVSQDREDFMFEKDASLRNDPGFDGWGRLQNNYFVGNLCQSCSDIPIADTYHDANSSNRIPNWDLKNKMLVHVTSIDKYIVRIAHTAQNRRFKEITGLSLTDFQRKKELNLDSVRQLAANIARSDRITRDFSEFLLKSLGPTQPPWWACFAQDVSQFIRNREWDMLVRMLGLGFFESGETLLIWVYPAKILNHFYRPTTIESACNHCHFAVSVNIKHDRTMPLLTAAKGGVREILHEPIDPKYINECNFWIGVVTEQIRDDASDQIMQYRDSHWKRLIKSHSKNRNIKSWIDRHH